MALDIGCEDIFYYTDNTIVMDQIAGSREKGVSDLSRGFGNLIAKVANEIPDGHLKFVPSQFNSADNLTREKQFKNCSKKVQIGSNHTKISIKTEYPISNGFNGKK